MRSVLAAAAVLALLLVPARPVSAHAILTRSVPAADETLSRAPAQIELYFSEAVEPNFSRITVLDSQGIAVDNADSRVDPAQPAHLTVSLRSLPDGVYTAAWRAVSAADGHLTEGSFPFVVGSASASALAAAQRASGSQGQSAFPDALLRGLLYLGFAALAGGTLFSQLAWRPSLRLSGVEGSAVAGFDRVYRRTAAAALLLLALTSLIGVFVQAGQASGTGIALPWSSQALSVWLSTRYGLLVIARAALLLILGGLLLPPSNRWNRWAALPVLALFGGTLSLQSHAAAQPDPLLPVAADLVHLLAASIWVGGLFLFLAGMLLSRRLESVPRTRLAAVLIPHFTNLALASVAVLTATGIYAWLLDVGGFPALVGTRYGQALLVKTGIALPMVAMGAYNLLITTPRMKRGALQEAGDAAWVAHFRRLLTSEAALGVLLLLWVGLFTSLPPARVASAPSGVTRSLRANDLSLALTIDPGTIGNNTFTLRVTSSGGPVNDASEVVLRFTAQSGKIASSEARMTAVGGGKYTLKGSYLSLADQWQVTAIVRRTNKFDAYAATQVNTSSAASGGLPLNQLAAVFLAVTTLAYAFAFFMLVPRRLTWIAAGQLPALLLILASLLAFSWSAPGSPHDPVNPVAPSASSMAAGEAAYQASCLSCHGPQGKGDGPVGLTLNPRPADLTQHAVPGVHTDGQLYEWITNGFPGSVMPAFKQTLSDTQRWDVVNFIRTLAPHS